MSNTVNNYTETDLGNISLNPRGEYDDSADYEYLDAVSYQGGSYFCLAELETTITGIAPDAGRNSEHWQMIAAPGDMTPEYTTAYNDVINKAVQVEASRAAVELAQQEIEAVQTDVQQLHSDTVQAAQEAENSKNSAVNSAQSAEQSRKTVFESEQNINGQIAGFDSRVSEAVEQSKEEINTTKQQAINTITNQQDASVNIVKTEGEKIITRVGNDAKTVADDRATVEEATQTVLNNVQEVARNAQIVAGNTENAAASAESAKTSADNAVQSAKSVEDASKQIEQNKKDVASLKEDLEISLLENDRLYEGTNLAEKFKDEIANYSDIWQWIKARIKAGNFTGIHVNDYIRWQTTDNKWIESCVAGINTYRRYGDREVPNHIDFISKDLWPTLHTMNPVDYNNGIIPTENLSGDGTKTAFVLTNEMAAVASVTIGGTATTAYTYNADTHTITFTDAPAAGTNNIVVTGTGSEYPWLASDLYLYVNSLKGHVAGGTSKTSPVKLVDYTNDGIWSKLPEALKSVIVTKHVLLPQRYSTSGVLLNNNFSSGQDIGKLWIPSEIEVYGCGIWADNLWDKCGFVQYPIFNCNMRRVKGLGDGGARDYWWLISACAGVANLFCRIDCSGLANSTTASNTWVGLPVCFRIA